MTREITLSLLMLGFGAWLAVHCFRASRDAQRRGIIRTYPYGHEVRRGNMTYTVTLAMSFAASAMGAFFFVFGAALAVTTALEMMK